MELFDLYDKDRVPLGATVVRGEPIPRGACHIVIHVCVFNAAGEMLIQRRQPFKEGWSGMWDVTCGGSAVAGETSAQAASRELAEEIGLKVSFEDRRPVLTTHFDVGFDDFYTLVREVDLSTLTLQPEEVAEVRWADRDEVLSMIEAGTFIPYRAEFISLLFAMQAGRGMLLQ